MDDQRATRLSLLTNHGRLLLTLIENPDQRKSALAAYLQTSEKTVQRYISDLEEAGVVRRIRKANCNVYEVQGADRFDAATSSVIDFLNLLPP